MATKVSTFCSGPGCYADVEFELPEPFRARYPDGIYCGDCAPIVEFTSEQCPGCVSGFPDCGLLDLQPTAAQIITLESGKCPIRVNGTIGVTVGRGGMSMEDVDLGDPAVVAGQKVAEMLQRER